MLQCPGQDTRFWTPDDIYDVPCEACGTPVEFFKSDVSRRCPQCGKRLQSPRVRMGCARWCAYAKQCLGFDPKEVELVDGDDVPLLDRLTDALKQELGDDQARVTHALLVLDRAQELLQVESANPQVVMAAALLHDVGTAAAAEAGASSEKVEHTVAGAALAERITREAGMDDAAIEQVREIVENHHGGAEIDTPEFRIVWDADRLEEVPAGVSRQSAERVREIVDSVFRTEAGRRSAYRLLVG